MTLKDWADILSKFSPVALLSAAGGYLGIYAPDGTGTLGKQSVVKYQSRSR